MKRSRHLSPSPGLHHPSEQPQGDCDLRARANQSLRSHFSVEHAITVGWTVAATALRQLGNVLPSYPFQPAPAVSFANHQSPGRLWLRLRRAVFFCGYCPDRPNSPCQVRSSAYFPGSLCQRRLRDAKQRKQWRNALKSPGPARFSGAMLGSATFLCQKAVSANDNWRRPRSWIRPTKHGSKTICRLLR